MEIGWTDRAGNEEELQGIKKERNNLHRIKRRRLIALVTSCVGTAF